MDYSRVFDSNFTELEVPDTSFNAVASLSTLSIIEFSEKEGEQGRDPVLWETLSYAEFIAAIKQELTKSAAKRPVPFLLH